MKEFLLNNEWIFGVFGIVVMFLSIHFNSFWVGKNSKIEDVMICYAVLVLVYGSVHLWTHFFQWLLK